jgi:hypothetical protein
VHVRNEDVYPFSFFSVLGRLAARPLTQFATESRRIQEAVVVIEHLKFPKQRIQLESLEPPKFWQFGVLKLCIAACKC